MRLRWKIFLLFSLLMVVVSAAATDSWALLAGAQDWDFARFLIVVAMGCVLTLGAAVWLTGPLENLVREWQRTSNPSPEGQRPVGGEVAALSSSLSAIQERLQLQETRLKLDRVHLEAVLQTMEEGLLITDSKGRISNVNTALCRMLSIGSEVVGKMPIEVVRDAELQQACRDAQSGCLPARREIKIGDRLLQVRFAPLCSTGSSRGVVAVFRDDTEVRRLERVRRDFASNVSHELKTPLTSIKGYSETLMDDESIGTIQKGFVETIYRNADQLQQLLDALLDLARLESKDFSLRFEDVPISRVVDEIVSHFSPQLRAKKIQWSFRNPANLEVIRVAQPYFSRVLLNLVENALNFTEAGSIGLEIEASNSDYVFTVWDTGVGIPPKEKERVFERFYRVAETRPMAPSGSGVGLSIARHIVQLHGGRIWLESQLGQGTRVSFSIPSLSRSAD